MKKISILSVFAFAAGFLLVVIFSESNAQSPAKVRKAIEESNKDFVRWYNRGELDSLVSLYRDDACLVGKGCGKLVITKYYGTQLEIGFKFKELRTYDLSIDNSLAVEKGRFTILLTSGQEIQGEYITEWKLTDKKWLIASDMASATGVDASSSGK